METPLTARIRQIADQQDLLKEELKALAPSACHSIPKPTDPTSQAWLTAIEAAERASAATDELYWTLSTAG